MKQFCSYHPTRAALWRCPDCASNFCQECIVEKPMAMKRSMHLCPRCNVPAARLGLSNVIEPFWNRLPRFFAYPLQVRSMMLILVLSIIATAAFSEDHRGLSGLVSAICSLVILKYSFEALRRTAQGDLDPPEISGETISADFSTGFKLFMIYFAVGFLFLLLVGMFNFVIGIIGLIMLMLLVPAMVIVLATSNSLITALNPNYFGRLALRMGTGYLIMYFFSGLLQSAPLVIAWALKPLLPEHLVIFLYNLAMNYYTLVALHLMGYAILQYHEEIGYEVAYEDRFLATEQKATPVRKETGLMNRVNICITDGRIEDAIKLFREETKESIDDPELSDKYYQLLKSGQKTSEQLSYAVRHLDLLGRAGKKEDIMVVYRECTALDKGFTPSGAMAMKIANYLSTSGDPREAVNLLNRFIKAAPNAPQAPHAYLLAANILTNHLMNPEKAVQILRHMQKTFPSHEIILEVEELLQKISLAHGIR